jgi:hypothetical protein
MKLYGSFLIRCWVIRNDENDLRTVFDVEHIQRGEHLRVGNLDEANQWMLQTLHGELIQSAEPEKLGWKEPKTEDCS